MASSRQLAWWTGGALTLIAGVAIAVHVLLDVPLGRPIAGIELSTLGLVLQAIALIAGVVAINLAPHAKARGILIVQGIVCLAAYGPIAIAWVWMLLAWWLLLGGAKVSALRFAGAIVLTGAFAYLDPAHGLVFALLFGMRLAIVSYDRWQNRETKTTLGDFLVYVLPAPLIIVVPYLAIIPLYDRFSSRLSFGLTIAKLELATWQLFRAALAGGAYLAASQWQPEGIVGMYWSLLLALLELAAVGYIALPLLALHGVVERSPLDEPWRATRISELWRRYGVHLRDALWFLFYAPALLRMRRWNRYARVIGATWWTVFVGNTLLHVVLRYAYLDDGWERTQHALLGNAVLATVLVLDYCHLEWRGAGPRSLARQIIGGVVAFTLAALVSAV